MKCEYAYNLWINERVWSLRRNECELRDLNARVDSEVIEEKHEK